MTGAPKPSRALLEAVKADLAPLRPLAAPWRRAGPVLVWVAAAGALVLAVLGIRHDAPLLGSRLTWGTSLPEVLAGLALVVLALGQAIPGRGLAVSRLAGGAAVGVGMMAVVSFMTSFVSPGVVVADPFVTKGPACLTVHVALGLSAFALVAALVLRARPIRARGALVLAGLGTGMAAEGVYRLHCGISDLRHVGLWHGGAVAAVVLSGLALGSWWEGRVAREMAARLSAPR